MSLLRPAPLSSGVRPVPHNTSTLTINRPLTVDETRLVRWILEHGTGDNSTFLEQLRNAQVCGLCPCGCASIDLAIAGRAPGSGSMEILGDFQWRSAGGHLNGAFVFSQAGTLSGLEVWSVDGGEMPDKLPAVEQLAPFSAVRA